MKKNYTLYSTILVGLLALHGTTIQAQSEQVEKTKQILTFGDWKGAGNDFGVDTQNIPTEVKDFFYNKKGHLVKTINQQTQLGDNPATILKVEKLGDLTPIKYTSYDYDENDQLVSVVECGYKASNGWFFQWTEPDTLAVYTYDAEGKLATKKEAAEKVTYFWDKAHLIKEQKKEIASEKLISTKYYYDFISIEANLAKKVVEVNEQGAFVSEKEYDEKGQLMRVTTHHLINPVKDNTGAIINGEKGMPCTLMTRMFDPDKEVFVTNHQTYENGSWKHETESQMEVVAKYDLTLPVAEITIDSLKTRDNSVTLTFPCPENTDSELRWNVYRNGELLGEANFFNNQWEYIDLEAANGVYDYYVVADTLNSPGCKAISNVVSRKYACNIPTAKDLRVFNSGKQTKEDAQTEYVCHLTWKAPKTSNTILGYNLYLNDSKQPVNPQLLTMPFYELHLDQQAELKNKVAVEIVYAEGYALAAPVEFTIDGDHAINERYLTNVQKVVTLGNSEGSLGSTTVSKEEINYYDNDNKLVMTVNESRLLGDDPDTPEEEHAGDAVPTSYSVYDYNENNQLVEERTREYGVFSGYDKAWNKNFVTTLKCKYDENTGKLIERAEENKTYRYTWEGENIVTEASFSNRKMEPLGLITYSDFSDAGVNLPRYGLGISKHPYMESYNRVYEFDYDEKGRLIAKREFKHGENVEKNENGEIVKADKGTPVEEQIWTYEGDYLKSYARNKWKSSAKALCPYNKKEFTLTAKGLREENYNYSDMSTVKGWSKSNIITETVNTAFYDKTAPTQLTAIDLKDQVNSFRLTCAAPQQTFGEEVTYQVYRNGEVVGKAHAEADGKLVYEEKEVPNGTWHYLIKPASTFESVDFLSSNVLEKTLNTELPIAENVAFPVNGVKENGDYQLVVTWEAPKTNLNIIGYNVYTDIKSYTKNPSPVNGVTALPASARSYEFNWASTTRKDKTVAIEVVYNIGKVKTENIAVTLNSTPTGIEEYTTTGRMSFVDNTLKIEGSYNTLSLYAVNGTLIHTYNGTSEINLSMLPNGVYIAKVSATNGSESFKIVKR